MVKKLVALVGFLIIFCFGSATFLMLRPNTTTRETTFHLDATLLLRKFHAAQQIHKRKVQRFATKAELINSELWNSVLFEDNQREKIWDYHISVIAGGKDYVVSIQSLGLKPQVTYSMCSSGDIYRAEGKLDAPVVTSQVVDNERFVLHKRHSN